MRRTALTVLGLLELTVSVALVVLGGQLPNGETLTRGFDRVRAVTAGAAIEVDLLREQVEDLREQDLHGVAKQLRENAHAVAATVQNGRLDFGAIESLAAALGDVSRGLQEWAATLDAERLKKLGDGLTAAADYVEQNVTAPAGKAIDRRDQSVATLETNARRLAALLQSANPTATLPAVGGPVAEVLRVPGSLGEVPASLRQARKLVDDAGAHWPALTMSITRSAAVLSGAQKQLQSALGQRDQYESAIQSSAELAKVTADLLPPMTDRLDARLGQQELSLERMGHSLNDVHAALPDVQRTAGELIGTFRWLLWLVAGLVALHGAFVVATNLPLQRASGSVSAG